MVCTLLEYYETINIAFWGVFNDTGKHLQFNIDNLKNTQTKKHV